MHNIDNYFCWFQALPSGGSATTVLVER